MNKTEMQKQLKKRQSMLEMKRKKKGKNEIKLKTTR